MNKTAMKNFAVWARKKLREDITYKAGLLGVSEKGIAEPLPESSRDLQFFDIGTKAYGQAAGNEIKQRNALVHAIQEKARTSDYKTAFDAIIEEAAYTWFNRLLAIRLMEVNDYLPSRVRVLSSETSGKREPDLVTAPFDTDLEFTEAEQEKIMKLKDDASSAASDALFRMLFIKQCNKLHEILPELFEETLDYTELLLNISFTDPDGIVSHLINDIAEDDFDISRQGENGEAAGQVEIIGWLYQYYNTELNNLVYDGSMSKCRIPKELLPAATTIYTPDWVIQYMTENSLGRLWVEGRPNNSNLKENWKYYLEEAEQETDVQAALAKIREEHAKLAPEDLKVIDPCMGSGHILVYCFDVLMQIYESQGYTQRDAVQAIFEHNLFGLDIDKRAAQLTYFAVMIKGRQHDRRFFSRGIKPHIYAIEESNDINRNQLAYFGADLSDMEKNLAAMQMTELLDTFTDAKEYGSILNVNQYDWDLLQRYVKSVSTAGQLSFDAIGIEDTQAKLLYLLEIAKTMAQKYHVVVTNPPYLGSARFSDKLEKYVKEHYVDVKNDLSMIIYKHAVTDMVCKNGYASFITTASWMSLSSFQKLREFLNMNLIFTSLVDFGTELFDGKVGHNPIVAWVSQKTSFEYKMTAIRLVEYCYSRREEKKIEFFDLKNRFYSNQNKFSQIPGSPVAYYESEALIRTFEYGIFVSNYAKPRQGMSTCDVNRFSKFWHEIEIDRTNIRQPENVSAWVKYNKGGSFRRWYGNREYVVYWGKNGNDLITSGALLRNKEVYFQPFIAWTKISSSGTGFRQFEKGFLFDGAGGSLFMEDNSLSDKFLLGLLNSKVGTAVLALISPTLNYNENHIGSIPVIKGENSDSNKRICEKVDECVDKAIEDWDSYESSWDFKRNPLV